MLFFFEKQIILFLPANLDVRLLHGPWAKWTGVAIIMALVLCSFPLGAPPLLHAH
jgi:hypothetical protein